MAAIVKYSLLTFPLASFGLGVWQIKRLEWKKDLIARLEAKLKEEPIELVKLENLQDLDALEYRRVKVRGRFDRNPRRQMILKPRQLVVNDEAIFRGRTAHQSNYGVNIVTPFQVEGTDLRVLVNRGWLATKGRDSVENSTQVGLGPENESIDVVGIIRKTDNRPRYGMKNNDLSNEWQIRDVEAMARVLNTAPIFIDADKTLSRGEGPIGGQTQLNVRNEHLNYAITWFSLAAFSYVMWHTKYGRLRFLFRKKLKR